MAEIVFLPPSRLAELHSYATNEIAELVADDMPLTAEFYEHFLSLIGEVLALRGAIRWHDIKTAPRNGKPVLLCNAFNPLWEPSTFKWTSAGWVQCHSNEGRPLKLEGFGSPTHWSPVLPLPKA